jgi:ornithine cyclodeaminase
MPILVLTQSDVEQLLDMAGCMDAMADVLAALARDELFLPLRMIAFPPGENSGIGLMPAHRGGANPAYALKTICLFPDNPSRGLDPHQGTVSLFSGETGELRALMNASAITAIRTAAVSGVATRLLAREDAQDLAIVGAGTRRTHTLRRCWRRGSSSGSASRRARSKAPSGWRPNGRSPPLSTASRRPCARRTSSAR